MVAKVEGQLFKSFQRNFRGSIKAGKTSNHVENYFSVFKRGMRGVYQHCSEKHLQRYLDEFDFRYSRRDIDDVERAKQALEGIAGKRLTCRRTA